MDTNGTLEHNCSKALHHEAETSKIHVSRMPVVALRSQRRSLYKLKRVVGRECWNADHIGKNERVGKRMRGYHTHNTEEVVKIVLW